jgi:hypothetical protein
MADDIKIIVDSSEVVTANNRIDKLGNSGAVAKKGIDKAVRGMNQFGVVTKNSGKNLNTFNMQIQQGGYQLQDFVVQLQSGTSFFTAFGQQGSQFAGVFGPKGAVVGAIIAIGSAVGGMAYNMIAGASATRTLEDALKELDGIISEIDSSTKLLSGNLSGLYDEFGIVSDSAITLASSIQDLGMRKAADGANALKEELLEMYNGNAWMNTSRAEEMYTALNIGGRSAKVFMQALNQLENAGDLESQAEAATQMREQFVSLVGSADKMTDAQLSYFTSLLDTEAALARLLKKVQESTPEALEAKRRIEEQAELELALFKENQAYENQANKARTAYLKKEKSLDAAGDLTILNAQAKAELDLFKQNAAYEKRIAKEVQKEKASQAALDAAGDKAILTAQAKAEIDLFKQNSDYEASQKALDASGDLAILNNQAQAEINLMAANAKYESDQNALRQKELDETNKKITELAERLSIPFAQALGLIRQAKAEATVGLDAFGGAGDFKYSVPTKFKPSEDKKTKAPKDALVSLMENLELQRELLGVEQDRASVLQTLGEDRSKYTQDQIQQAVDATNAIRLQTEELEKQERVADTISQSFGDAFMSIVDGTMSAKDAFRSMAADIIRELYRILVVETMVQSIKRSIFPFAMAGPVQGPNLPEVSLDGGGYTGSGPRSGGLDGKGGFMAMLHPRETVVDHTKGQGVGGDTVTVNQTINVTTGVQQTVRAEVMGLMPQIAEASKAAVLDAKRRGGAFGKAFS